MYKSTVGLHVILQLFNGNDNVALRVVFFFQENQTQQTNKQTTYHFIAIHQTAVVR